MAQPQKPAYENSEFHTFASRITIKVAKQRRTTTLQKWVNEER